MPHLTHNLIRTISLPISLPGETGLVRVTLFEVIFICPTKRLHRGCTVCQGTKEVEKCLTWLCQRTQTLTSVRSEVRVPYRPPFLLAVFIVYALKINQPVISTSVHLTIFQIVYTNTTMARSNLQKASGH